jgi:cell division protein FtsB
MSMKYLKRFMMVVLFLTTLGFTVRPVAAQQVTVDAKTIERLENLINTQQKQLEALQQEVNQLKQTAATAQSDAKEAKSVAEEVKVTVQAPADKVVTSGQERVKLVVSGQVNRAMNIADDGDKTKAYFVDNGASNSRLRLVGTAKMGDDLTIGTRL